MGSTATGSHKESLWMWEMSQATQFRQKAVSTPILPWDFCSDLSPAAFKSNSLPFSLFSCLH